jgi:ubiquinone/menaquinone biosynthesis C-methylase UbiE
VVSDYVVEHIRNPLEHLREVFRVLVPGGVYVLWTPNLFNYVGMVASATPHWFHTLVSGRLRGQARGLMRSFRRFTD